MRRAERRSSLRRWVLWHRYAGVSASAILILVAVSGVLLNHTEDLRLDTRPIATGWLLDWYGVAPPLVGPSYVAAGRRVTQVEDRLYLDTVPSCNVRGLITGAVAVEGLVAVAAGEELILLDAAGRLVERLTDLPGPPQRLGVAGDRLVIATVDGAWHADPENLDWQPLPGAPIAWAQASPPPAAVAAALIADRRAHVLSVERLLLDLHSGRIAGTAGVIIVDAAAVLLLLLALTGLRQWARRR